MGRIKWFSVKNKRRPLEYAETVLIGRKEGNAPAVMAGFWDGRDFRAFGVMYSVTFADPTHWAYLPGPESIGRDDK